MQCFANLEKLSFELNKSSSNLAQYFCGADPDRSARCDEMVFLLEFCHDALSPTPSNAEHNLFSPKSLPPDTTRIKEIDSLLGSLLIDELSLDKPGAFESICALRPVSQGAKPFSLNFKIDTLKKVYSILGRVSTGTEDFNSSIEWKDGKLSLSEIGSRSLENLLSLSSDFYLLYLALGEPSDLKWTIECFRQQKFLETAITLYDVRGHSSPHLWMPDIWRIRYAVCVDEEAWVSDDVTFIDSSSITNDCHTKLSGWNSKMSNESFEKLELLIPTCVTDDHSIPCPLYWTLHEIPNALKFSQTSILSRSIWN